MIISENRVQPAKAVEQKQDAQRLVTVDSLRGVAALTVMFGHYLLTLPSIWPYNQQGKPLLVTLLEFSPLHLLWAGYEAVVLFFVLSGFVLALPYWSGRTFKYRPFIIKRWARIWIPYIVVVTVTLLVSHFVGDGPVSGTSSWFEQIWDGQSLAGYFNHVLLIGSLERYQEQFLPVVWSLKYEMLASILFPVLLYVGRLQSWIVVLFICAVLSVLGIYFGSKLRLLQFLPMFLIGSMLARYKDDLVAWFRRIPWVLHIPMLVVALLLYVCRWLFWTQNPLPFQNVLIDWGIMLACAFAVVTALATTAAHALLSWRPFVWLGRISYSVYLTHMLVEVVVLQTLGDILPLWLLLVCCVPLTLAVSHLAYRWIELPAVAVGKRLTRSQTV